MKKVLLAFLVAASLCCGAAVRAQSQILAPTPTPAPVQQTLTLEERYTQCIRTALCPLQTRLQLVQEENDAMLAHFLKIYEACAGSTFQGCVDSQQAEMDMWHGADYRASQLMLSIEAESLAVKEAAAGGPDKPPAEQKSKSLWDRIWGK